jgi:hypothetical protein
MQTLDSLRKRRFDDPQRNAQQRAVRPDNVLADVSAVIQGACTRGKLGASAMPRRLYID